MSAFAQSAVREVYSREQAWLAYFNQTRMSNRFGVWVDAHYRMTGDFIDRPFQLIVRPALTTYIKENLRLHTGYAHINHFPAEGFQTSRPEHRTWQQIWWNQKLPNLALLQWLRLEQRYLRNMSNDNLKDGYSYANRLRYNAAFTVPLKGGSVVAGTPFALLTNELFLNFGPRVVYNTFDQNRLFVGAGYQFNSAMNAQVGYMHVYQQESSGNRYAITHALRLNVVHSLDWRKNGP